MCPKRTVNDQQSIILISIKRKYMMQKKEDTHKHRKKEEVDLELENKSLTSKHGQAGGRANAGKRTGGQQGETECTNFLHKLRE